MNQSQTTLLSEHLEKEREYWLNKLAGDLALTELPLDFQRPEVFDERQERAEIAIDRETLNKLLKASRKNSGLTFSLLVAALKIFLHKYTSEKDTYRSMKPELAIDLISGLFKFSSTVSRLESVDNILPKNYVREVLPFINPPENVTIFYEVKADLAEQDVEVLSKAGVRAIQPGIESLSTSTLKLMKKETSSF